MTISKGTVFTILSSRGRGRVLRAAEDIAAMPMATETVRVMTPHANALTGWKRETVTLFPGDMLEAA